MKSVKWFKNKTQMYIYIFLVLLLLGGFIYVSTLQDNQEIISDSEKFVLEHEEVSKDNVFVYVDAQQAYDLIKEDNIILFFGTPKNKWVTYYANILNEVAKEKSIDKIYYYDVLSDRTNSNATYQAIVEVLKDYATVLDDETKNIYTPSLLVKSLGVVSYFDDETALIKGSMSPEKYYNNYETNLKKVTLENVIENYIKGLQNGK